jgi:hypothetical protein
MLNMMPVTKLVPAPVEVPQLPLRFAQAVKPPYYIEIFSFAEVTRELNDTFF